MPTRDFYTLAETARVLEIPQRRLLEMLETGEIEGEQDPLSSRWKISKHAVNELVSAGPTPEGPTEEFPERSTEMIEELVDELGDLHREVGRLRNRLNLARRTEKEERELLLAELDQERERHREERERADRLQDEANGLREELENEQIRGLGGGWSVGKGEAVATEDPCPLSGPGVLLPGLFPCAPLEAFRSVPKLKGLRLGVTDLELARVGER